MWEYMNTNELVHHGILGQKWGVRRYQNKDGSYTNAGKKRYSSKDTEMDGIPEPNFKILSKEKEAALKKRSNVEYEEYRALKSLPEKERNNILRLKNEVDYYMTQSVKAQKSKTKINPVNGVPTVILKSTKESKMWSDKYDKAYKELHSKLLKITDPKVVLSKNESLKKIDDVYFVISGKNGKHPYDAYPKMHDTEDDQGRYKWMEDHIDLTYGGSSYARYDGSEKAYDYYYTNGGPYREYAVVSKVQYPRFNNTAEKEAKHSAIQPWSYTNTNELCHYGRKGMKWGVRLYQNSDGSLTALGRQRYGTKENFGRVVAAKQKAAAFKKNKKAYEKQAAKNAKADEEIREIKRKAGMKTDNSQNGLPKGKKISEMSNKEIQERINRIQLEKTLRREMASVQVERISRGKKAVDTLLKVYNNQAVQTAIINPVAKQVGKKLTDAMSGGEMSKSERLKKQKDDYMNEWQINKYKKETAEFKKAYEDMRRDPAYRTVFDKADRQQVKKDDARINKEMQREQQRAQDKADLKANREAAKERKRQQQDARMEEYRRQQEAQVAERERKQREQTQARLVDDTVYNQYLLNKNAEALRREEERRRRGGR